MTAMEIDIADIAITFHDGDETSSHTLREFFEINEIAFSPQERASIVAELITSSQCVIYGCVGTKYFLKLAA